MSELLDKINKEFKYSCLGTFDAINPKDLPKIINLCMDAFDDKIDNIIDDARLRNALYYSSG